MCLYSNHINLFLWDLFNIFCCSSEVNEGKSSALDLTRALHKKINLTLSTLDNKISALEKEFAEKRQLALHALNALHHGTSDTKDEKSGEHSRTLEAR